MRLRTPLVVTAVAAAMIGGACLPAMAAPGDTVTTFSLTGGGLSLTAQTSAALTDAATGTTGISGSLGNVSVTDARGGTTIWVTSATSTAFTGDLGSSSTAVSYTGGTVTEGGTITVADGTAKTLTGTPLSVVAPTAVSGNNTASWNPTLNVTMPAGALADDYSGTVTTSVA